MIEARTILEKEPQSIWLSRKSLGCFSWLTVDVDA